ncbi:MAG: T9SS type A sorting domain-containing protein, partial [Bacteroidota bacterium]
ISLFVNVENRNRAPLATNASRTLEYFGKGFSDEHTLAEYFTDPDGDALTFTIVNGAPAVADVFTSTSKFMIKTLTIGETSVIFKVQDGQGGEIIDTVKVIVHNVLGVNEDLHAGIKVYPNPVGEMTTIQLSPEWKGQITFEICDITGKVQAIKQTMSTQATQIDVSDLRRGLYVLRVSSQHKTATIKLIKE